jgi:hypothetical protein
MRLEGKVAIISGAGNGMGAEEARVRLQICTHTLIYAILASHREGGQNGAHPCALSSLPKRSGHQRR